MRDRYYKTGSGIELACVVRPSCPDSRVPYPVWRKNGETLPDHVNVYHINGWAYIASDDGSNGASARRIYGLSPDLHVYVLHAHRILSTNGYISLLLSSRNTSGIYLLNPRKAYALTSNGSYKLCAKYGRYDWSFLETTYNDDISLFRFLRQTFFCESYLLRMSQIEMSNSINIQELFVPAYCIKISHKKIILIKRGKVEKENY